MPDDRNEFIYFPMMTVSEAARLLGVGKKVDYQLIEFGQRASFIFDPRP